MEYRENVSVESMTVLNPSACVHWVWGECAWGVRQVCAMWSGVDSLD